MLEEHYDTQVLLVVFTTYGASSGQLSRQYWSKIYDAHDSTQYYLPDISEINGQLSVSSGDSQYEL